MRGNGAGKSLFRCYERDFIERLVAQFDLVLEARGATEGERKFRKDHYRKVLLKENGHGPVVHLVEVGENLLKYCREEIEKGIKKKLDEISG